MFLLFVDVTAVCILEVFQNQQSMLLADKVLKQLGKEKAKEKYKVGMWQKGTDLKLKCNLHHIFISSTLSVCSSQNREPLMPSPQFIKSYFSSFTDDIISQPLQKGEKKDEDKDKEGEASEVTGRWELRVFCKYTLRFVHSLFVLLLVVFPFVAFIF